MPVEPGSLLFHLVAKTGSDSAAFLKKPEGGSKFLNTIESNLDYSRGCGSVQKKKKLNSKGFGERRFKISSAPLQQTDTAHGGELLKSATVNINSPTLNDEEFQLFYSQRRRTSTLKLSTTKIINFATLNDEDHHGHFFFLQHGQRRLGGGTRIVFVLLRISMGK